VVKLLVLIIVSLLSACGNPAEDSSPQRLSAADILGSNDVEGFLRAEQPRLFSFPEDHGRHDGFRNEWWYLTGNLETEAGRRYGYQVTFFSTAIRAGDKSECVADMSAWCTNAIWMGHAAISDVSEDVHYAAERFTRQEPGLAGTSLNPFRVWLQDWKLFSGADDFPWELEIFTDDFVLTLSLSATKQAVLQGVNGLSQKSPEPGNASYYYSLTNVETAGQIFLGGENYQVAGSSWLDREWSTSALAADQSGWDWFSLQFDEGYELMYYQLRNLNGDAHLSSSGNTTSLMGTQTQIMPEQMQLEEIGAWQAPDGTVYATKWQMKYLDNDWIVQAVFEDQLVDVSFQYWEGAVDVIESASGEVVGRGYLEMVR
jgi:predicted secreted hydrolase